MNKVKHILLNYFSKYSSNKVAEFNNPELPKVISFIILGYCTPYYEVLSSSKCNNAIIIKKITNNRIAIGMNDGSICVLDLSNSNKITKTPSTKISDENKNSRTVSIFVICQISCDTIAYGIHDCFYTNRYEYKNFYFASIWKIGNESENIFQCDRFEYIIPLENDLIACVSKSFLIQKINLKTNEIHRIDNINIFTKSLMSVDNKILFGVYDYEKGTEICTINKNDIILNSEVKTFIIYRNSHANNAVNKQLNIIACTNNNIIIIDSYWYNDSNNKRIFNNSLDVFNDQSKKSVNIISNCSGEIKSSVYLNNGYFALLIDKNIVIYNITSKSHVQTIVSGISDFVLLEALENGKFVTIDDNSNMKIYE